MLFRGELIETTFVSKRGHEQMAVVVRIAIENDDGLPAAADDEITSIIGESRGIEANKATVVGSGKPTWFGARSLFIRIALDVAKAPGSPKLLVTRVIFGNGIGSGTTRILVPRRDEASAGDACDAQVVMHLSLGFGGLSGKPGTGLKPANLNGRNKERDCSDQGGNVSFCGPCGRRVTIEVFRFGRLFGRREFPSSRGPGP